MKAMVQSNNCPHLIALAPRTAALLILFYQIRLLAADLADTPVFITALAGALAAAVFLFRIKINGRHVRPIEAVIIIATVPWAIRLFVALPRLFFTGVSANTILLDSMLLNLDRNNFAALLPFYWLAITTYFSQKNRLFLRAEIIAADTLFLVLFSIVPSASIDAYRWPILMIALFALILFLQILSLVLSTPPELKLRRSEGLFAGAFLFMLIFLGSVFFIRPFEERAIERGGGLLTPNLFRFDFSQVLRLESEIRLNDDLVMIVRKDPDDYNLLLRRYTLSGYNPGQGFFRMEDIDEEAHPKSLPGRRTLFMTPGIEAFRVTDQEYYIVNFDASAFIGMNMPVEVVPFETWDASSFNSAYAVRSHTSEALPFELMQAVHGQPGAPSLGLSPDEYALYTEYGMDERIASFAREIIQEETFVFRGWDEPSYWEQIQMIYGRLKYGEYRYSLRPGIAPDGDQLKHFLFGSKKGYCSYFAFAFTLMLRSVGIPSRVAAGFFIDPSAEAFNYHPVRADMAHAWTEVWFPGYGWIEYDPTSQIMADGEEFRFSQGTPPELFQRLIKEILDNRSRLRVREGEEADSVAADLRALGVSTLRFFAQRGPLLVFALLALLFLSLRSGFLWLSLLSGNPRRKAVFLWAHVKRRLALAGYPCSGAEAEWVKTREHIFQNTYSLYLGNAAARFAPVYDREDFLNMVEQYRLFSEVYRNVIPAGRRFLTWLLPPLALIIVQHDKKIIKDKITRTTGIFLILFFLLSLRGETQEDSSERAETLYENALAAQSSENWERAIELYSIGARAFPQDFRFPCALGNLYYNRSLFNLAWDEYRRAEGIMPPGTDNQQETRLFFQLANTAGYLNKNELSAAYLERVLAIEPDNREAIGSLAWMYFKLFRLPEGERLLLDAINRLGPDMDFTMTLGNIYSGMFRYQEAKDAYLETIQGAENVGDRLFAALSHYNLSILENRFYQYSLAYDRANDSLAAMNRSSGRLARGELYLARMELPRALAEYEEAYGMDSSPLSRLNLAQFYLVGGRLAEAVLYANACLKAEDESWMVNYGIDPVRYKRDIHKILRDSYEGLYNAETFFCPGTLRERIQSAFRKVSYRFRYAQHSHLFRKYSLLSATAHGVSDEIHLEALLQYFNAFEAYPRRAFTYLSRARSFEEPIIPESAASYDYQEGRLFKNTRLLAELPMEFDPLWQRGMIARVYAELALIGRKAERQNAAERLFAINRGALLQNGIRLPVELRITGEINRGAMLRRAVRAAGFETARLESPRYTLTLDSGVEGSILCTLYDNGRGITVWQQNLPAPNRRSPQRANFARTLRDGVFQAF